MDKLTQELAFKNPGGLLVERYFVDDLVTPMPGGGYLEDDYWKITPVDFEGHTEYIITKGYSIIRYGVFTKDKPWYQEWLFESGLAILKVLKADQVNLLALKREKEKLLERGFNDWIKVEHKGDSAELLTGVMTVITTRLI